MVIDRHRLKVVSPIGGMRFKAGISAETSASTTYAVTQTEEYSYEIEDILELSAETKNEMGAVRTWRVQCNDKPDVVITEHELNAWRHECVIELAIAA